MITTREFLDVYEHRTQKSKERPLYLLLRANEKNIKGLLEHDPHRFHKSFRQMDIVYDDAFTYDNSSGYTDQAIHILLEQAKIFWDVLEEFLEFEQHPH